MALIQLGTSLPREVHIWIQSLNLTYKIQNPKRDLANGWLYAEILQRYYPNEIEMYQFDNGFKLEKRKNNWEHLQKIFKKKNMPIQFSDWDPVMHAAPNAAYDLLKKFYTILTGRELNDQLQPIQEQYLRDAQDPEYAKPTIARKMKEKELVRIPDEKIQQDMAKTIITAHNEMLRADREINPERFTFQKMQMRQFYEQESMQSKKRTMGQSQLGAGRSEMDIQAQLNPAEIKQVQVKTANKQIRGLRQAKKDNKGGFATADDDNDEITFDVILSDIIGSTLANRMGKNDPEYKNFKESFDQVTNYFTERFSFISDELIHDVFTEINSRAKDIVAVISKKMMDFCDLMEFFSAVIRQTNPVVTSSGSNGGENSEEVVIFKLIIETLTKIGNLILNEDPLQTELFFLEYAIDDLIEIMCQNEFKRTQLSVLLYCFCQNSANAHLRVLQRIKNKIGSVDKDNYIAIINDMLEFDEIEDDQYLWGSAEMYDFYYEVAKKGLYYTSSVSRTKSLSILSQLAPCSIKPIFELLPSIRKMVTVQNWELQGQLLILSDCALQELCKDKTKLSNDEEDLSDNIPRIAQMYSEKEAQQQIPQFLDIINEVFTPDCPKATQKIGLTYLASIIKQFPNLCDRYLEILLNVAQEIRSDILAVPAGEGDAKQYTKQEYVAGSSSGKYLAFSSYLHWDQTKIIQSLEKIILSNKMDNLEWPHLEVFKAACRIDSQYERDEKLQDQASEWIRIFKSLKTYIFLALCEHEFSDTAIEILETFTQKFIQVRDACLDESLEIMIKTLRLLYQPDMDNDCKVNIQRYLQSLYFGEQDNQKQKDFVYNAIKNFAEINQKAYQTSNLIELMNAIVQDRRGEIFVPEQSPQKGNQNQGEANPTSKLSSNFDATGVLLSPDSYKRTGTLKKSIMSNTYNLNNKQ